jgi:hypothetical protein
MTATTHFKNVKQNGFDVTINIIEGHEGSNSFSDMYTASEHIGGTTVQVPNELQSRNGQKYFIGQTTPAELAKWYAQQGIMTNPSKDAYKNLQDELGLYLTADTCWLEYVWYKNGIEVYNATSCCFEYSYDYSNGTLEYEAETIYVDHGESDLQDGVAEALEAVENMMLALA